MLHEVLLCRVLRNMACVRLYPCACFVRLRGCVSSDVCFGVVGCDMLWSVLLSDMDAV